MFGGCKRPIHSAPAGSACEGFFFRGHWYQALLNQAYGGAGSLWPALNPPFCLFFVVFFPFFFARTNLSVITTGKVGGLFSSNRRVCK